jgi:hypothetical protein
LSFFFTTIFVAWSSYISEYLSFIGNLNGVDAIQVDIRGQAQRNFFQNLNDFRFFFGYESNYIFAKGIDSDLLYTYSVFIDIWNRYGLIMFILFVVVLLNRFLKNVNFYFPLYYFIPFLVYSLIESIFFPNFWDSIIYILLFTPKGGFSGINIRNWNQKDLN